jgi:mannose/fructose/N-acetylgalactosamine-specific phosphotransferase system component IIC
VTAGVFAALLAWGMVAGIDLVSFLQVMVARPLVAATVAGAIVGDPVSGVLVGMLLELYALEVLPVGGARYPDYGPAAVAGTVAAAGGGMDMLGVGAVVGLLVAYAGEGSITILRRRNTRRVRAVAESLDAGDFRMIQRVQLGGIMWDAARALLLTGAGLGLGLAAQRWPPVAPRAGILLTAVLVGIGLGSAVLNGKRLAQGRAGTVWLGLGVAGGAAWLLLR